MKNKYGILLSSLILAAAVLFIGCTTTPPTKFEKTVFTVTTNTVEVTPAQTNSVVVTPAQTTNSPDGKEVVVAPAVVKDVVTPAVVKETYSYAPNAAAAEIAATSGAVGNLFGVGGLVSTAITGLFGIWAFIRSRKTTATAANLAQVVETVREFIKTLPNGQMYDNELVNWMQAHQAEENTLQSVMKLLQNYVSNPDAKVAAQKIQDTIDAITASVKNTTTQP